MDNKLWADEIIAKVDSSYQYRWQVYDQHVCRLLSTNTVWLDVGCGDNAVVQLLGHNARIALGVDKTIPVHIDPGAFVCADIYHLPLRPASVDLITLRFIMEHLQDTARALSEATLLLKPGGHILVITTNLWCPFISIARVLPFSMKRYMLRILYGVTLHDVQPTYHKFNSPRIVSSGARELKADYLEFLQDVNYTRRSLFFMMFFWHLITKALSLKYLRSCMIAVYEKRVTQRH